MAALVTDMFCSFYLVKNNKIADNSATTEAREKIRTYSESLEFWKLLMYVRQYLKTIKFYLIKLATHFLEQPSY